MALSGSTDPDLVTFLGTLGLVPGVEVVVVEKHPFDGPLVVTVDGQDRTLGETGRPPDLRQPPRSATESTARTRGTMHEQHPGR